MKNDNQHNQNDLQRDPEIEARIVAWVLGEASDFEIDQLTELVEQQPDWAVFHAETLEIHRLMSAVSDDEWSIEDENWQLPETKRAALQSVLAGEPAAVTSAAVTSPAVTSATAISQASTAVVARKSWLRYPVAVVATTFLIWVGSIALQNDFVTDQSADFEMDLVGGANMTFEPASNLLDDTGSMEAEPLFGNHWGFSSDEIVEPLSSDLAENELSSIGDSLQSLQELGFQERPNEELPNIDGKVSSANLGDSSSADKMMPQRFLADNNGVEVIRVDPVPATGLPEEIWLDTVPVLESTGGIDNINIEANGDDGIAIDIPSNGPAASSPIVSLIENSPEDKDRFSIDLGGELAGVDFDGDGFEDQSKYGVFSDSILGGQNNGQLQSDNGRQSFYSLNGVVNFESPASDKSGQSLARENASGTIPELLGRAFTPKQTGQEQRTLQRQLAGENAEEDTGKEETVRDTLRNNAGNGISAASPKSGKLGSRTRSSNVFGEVRLMEEGRSDSKPIQMPKPRRGGGTWNRGETDFEDQQSWYQASPVERKLPFINEGSRDGRSIDDADTVPSLQFGTRQNASELNDSDINENGLSLGGIRSGRDGFGSGGLGGGGFGGGGGRRFDEDESLNGKDLEVRISDGQAESEVFFDSFGGAQISGSQREFKTDEQLALAEISELSKLDKALRGEKALKSKLQRELKQLKDSTRPLSSSQVGTVITDEAQGRYGIDWSGYVPPKTKNAESDQSQHRVLNQDSQETLTQNNAFSTFSLHVSDVSFQLAKSALAAGQWPEADKIRIEEFVNAMDYGDPLPQKNQRVSCQIEQAIHPFLQQRNLLRISMRTAAFGRSQNTPLRLTLVLDQSGSMERPDRQQTVRRAFALLAAQLQPSDRITLISFARQPRLLADNVPAVKVPQLVKLVQDLPSEGGTNIEAALQLAFEKAQEYQSQNAQNRVILLTDGAVNLGNANPASLAKQIVTMRDAGIAFDAAGISPIGLNDDVLEALTRQGDGRYYVLDSEEAADSGFVRQITGALRPTAKNVKVQVQFNPQRVGRYQLLGFDKHRLKKQDFRNDAVDAAELAAAEAGVAMYQIEAKPDGTGDIGQVSVRFQDVSTGQMVEHTWPIPFEPHVSTCDQAVPSLKIATAATLLATKLKGGPMADTIELKFVAKLLSGLPDTVRSTKRVQQLATMVQQARQITGQ